MSTSCRDTPVAVAIDAAPPAPDAAKAGDPIVQAGSAVLRQRAREVPASMLGTPELRTLVDTMITTMRAAPGVGLAAPQIGLDWRVVVLEDREDYMKKLSPAEVAERQRVAFAPRVLINPTLRVIGDEHATFFEGCLSVEGYTGLVRRHLEVEVEGVDAEGAPQRWRVRGWPARILQHELDHLDGTLYIDRMLTRSFATVANAKQLYAGTPIAEVLDRLDLEAAPPTRDVADAGPKDAAPPAPTAR